MLLLKSKEQFGIFRRKVDSTFLDTLWLRVNSKRLFSDTMSGHNFHSSFFLALTQCDDKKFFVIFSKNIDTIVGS